jgi:DnaK suppressor protein
MQTNTTHIDTERRQMLRDMLVRLRGETYERIREIRRDQEQEAERDPGDEMDAARASSDVETHAGLIGRAEDKLKQLDEALARLEEGRYGACMNCGEPIPMERLIAVPFALYCVDCQQKRSGLERRSSQGGTMPPYDRQWTPPEEMSEASDMDLDTPDPEEDLSVHHGRAFGAEEEPEKGSTAEKARTNAPRKRSR